MPRIVILAIILLDIVFFAIAGVMFFTLENKILAVIPIIVAGMLQAGLIVFTRIARGR